jgi:hypothetical protein
MLCSETVSFSSKASKPFGALKSDLNMKSRLEAAGSWMSSLHLEMSTAGVYE